MASPDFERKGEPKRVFLSYAQEDAHLASMLASAIAKYGGEGLVLSFDAWSVELGSDLATTIASMVQTSDVMIIVLSKNDNNTWIGAELALGLAKSERDKDFKLIPIRTAGATVPILLQSRVYLDLAHSDVDTAARQIVDAVFSRRSSNLALFEQRDLFLSAQKEALEHIVTEYDRVFAEPRWLFAISLLVAAATLLLAIIVAIAHQRRSFIDIIAISQTVISIVVGYSFGRASRPNNRRKTNFVQKRIHDD